MHRYEARFLLDTFAPHLQPLQVSIALSCDRSQDDSGVVLQPVAKPQQARLTLSLARLHQQIDSGQRRAIWNDFVRASPPRASARAGDRMVWQLSTIFQWLHRYEARLGFCVAVAHRVKPGHVYALLLLAVANNQLQPPGHA